MYPPRVNSFLELRTGEAFFQYANSPPKLEFTTLVVPTLLMYRFNNSAQWFLAGGHQKREIVLEPAVVQTHPFVTPTTQSLFDDSPMLMALPNSNSWSFSTPI